MPILVDWGSSNFRAFLLRGGKVIERRRAAGGGSLKAFAGTAPEARSNEYSAFFVKQVGDWLKMHPGAPIYACGSVGGREGWIETQYSPAPAGIADLKRNLKKIPPERLGRAEGREIYVATGCAVAMADGRHDVMRSEEVKSLGAAVHLGMNDGLFCVPGTHGKWVEIRGGKIVHFETAISGEIFTLMSERGALAALFRHAPGQADAASFDAGLALADAGLDLMTDVWQVRAQALRAEKPPASLQAYFSGILMGHELRQMLRFYPEKPPVVLVMDEGPRRDYYRRGFAHAGWNVAAEAESETAVCAGLSALM